MILLCAVNVIETDEAMEASMHGLELHVQCVNSGYADDLHPSPYPSLNLSGTNSAQPLWTALGWQPRPKSDQLELKKKKMQIREFWESVLAPGGYRLVWVSSQTAERRGERRGTVDCRGSTYISGSEDSVMRAGTTLWATSVSFTPFTSSWSDWTEPAAMSQRWAGHWDKSEQHRQHIERKLKKRSEKGEGRDKEKYKKIGRKWYTMTRTIDAGHTTVLRVSSKCLYTQTLTRAHTCAHTDTLKRNPVSKKSRNAV